jgi:hypothetical protein
MKFKDKFKVGDIICSDRFHNGLCMIVEKYMKIDHSYRHWPERFKCQDLVKDDQKWSAYEFDSLFNKPNNWRIATDEDIVKYLSTFVEIQLGKVGERYTAKLTDSGIILEDDMFTSWDVHFESNELVDLKKIIDQRITL